MTSRILLLTGMTPDARIFKRILPLLPGASIVPWIAPRHHETIRSYARRLAATIDDSADVVVCGVSFGGVIARELALHLDAKACVLVSSVRDPKQLPPWFRCVRHFAGAGIESALASIGQAAALYPRAVRSGSTARLRKLAGEAGAWHRWATAALLRWQPSAGLDRIPLVQIHGDRDATFPLRYIQADHVIAGGGHVLPLSHSEEVAALLVAIAANPGADANRTHKLKSSENGHG